METIKASLNNVTVSKEKNLMVINGCIAKIGEPSTGAPCGAGGYNVCFTQEAANSCAKTFVNMPVNCVIPEEEWLPSEAILSGHGNTVIGFMRKCKVQGDNLMAEIVMWKDKYPWLAELTLNAMDALGFSVEMYPTKTHNDDKANIEYIDEFEGVGCAMLWSNAAAFSQTYIEKIAAKRSDNNMNEEIKKEIAEQVKASVEESVKSFAEVLASVQESMNEMKEEIKAAMEKPVVEESVEPQVIEAQADPQVAELVEEIAKLKAAMEEKDIPEPKAVVQAAANPNVSDEEPKDTKAEKLAKINVSNMTAMEKLRSIAKLNMKEG